MTSATLGFSMRRTLSSSERFTVVLSFVWIKMTSSKVTVNFSLLSVELLDMIGMARILTWLTAVKVVTTEDAMAAKSDPSVGNNHK